MRTFWSHEEGMYIGTKQIEVESCVTEQVS